MCGNDQAREQLASWLCTWQQSTAAEQHPTSSALMQDDCSDDDWFQVVLIGLRFTLALQSQDTVVGCFCYMDAHVLQ